MEQEPFDVRSVAGLFPGYDSATLIKCILDTSTELSITPTEVIDVLKQELGKTPHLDVLSAQMDDLPDEKLVEIALEIPDKNLLSFCLTSRRFAAICQDDHFWELKTKRRFGVSVEKRRKKNWTWKKEYKSRRLSFVRVKKYIVYRDKSFEVKEVVWDSIQEILESSSYTYDELITRVREYKGESLDLSRDDRDALMLSILISNYNVITPDSQLQLLGLTQFMSPEPIKISDLSDIGIPDIRITDRGEFIPEMFYTATEGGEYNLEKYPKLIETIRESMKYSAPPTGRASRWYIGIIPVLSHRYLDIYVSPESEAIYISKKLAGNKREFIVISAANWEKMMEMVNEDPS